MEFPSDGRWNGQLVNMTFAAIPQPGAECLSRRGRLMDEELLSGADFALPMTYRCARVGCAPAHLFFGNGPRMRAPEPDAGWRRLPLGRQERRNLQLCKGLRGVAADGIRRVTTIPSDSTICCATTDSLAVYLTKAPKVGPLPLCIMVA